MSNFRALFLYIVILLIAGPISLAESQKTESENSAINSDNLIENTAKDHAATGKDKNTSFSIFKETYVPVEQYEIKSDLPAQSKVIKANTDKLYQEERLIIKSLSLEPTNPHEVKTLKFHKGMLKTQKLMDKVIYNQIINQNHSKDLKLEFIKIKRQDFETGLGFLLPVGP